VQTLLSLQTLVSPGWHEPLAQMSSTVHSLLSEQSAAVKDQESCFWDESQTRQGFPAGVCPSDQQVSSMTHQPARVK